LALAAGFGLFRTLATDAKPDNLTYAVYFLAVLAYQSPRPSSRILGYVLWGLLIPFKNIAVVFIPAAIIQDVRFYRQRANWPELATAVAVWASFVLGVVAFNFRTIDAPTSPGHPLADVSGVGKEVVRFIVCIPRMLIIHWYGSLRDPVSWGPVGLQFLIGLYCALGLKYRADGWRRFGRLGLTTLAVSWLVLLVRLFYADMRLMGYGVYLLLVSFRPGDQTVSRWLLYGAVSTAVGVFNSVMIDSRGVNHPKYEQVVRELLDHGSPDGPIYSNSYHFLDIHGRVGSKLVSLHHDAYLDPTGIEVADDLGRLPSGAYFLHVTLPRYDPHSTAVWPVDPPGPEFREVLRVDGAVLYRKD
jgi:hypothetical protein